MSKLVSKDLEQRFVKILRKKEHFTAYNEYPAERMIALMRDAYLIGAKDNKELLAILKECEVIGSFDWLPDSPTLAKIRAALTKANPQ